MHVQDLPHTVYKIRYVAHVASGAFVLLSRRPYLKLYVAMTLTFEVLRRART